MISFKDIELQDKELITSYTQNSPRRNCDLSFSNLCSWRFLYNTKFAIMDGFLLLKFWANDELVYMMPIGNGDLTKVLDALVEDAHREGEPFCLLGICSGMCSELEAFMPGKFQFTADRDYADYLYLRTDLATLAGKKFQSKRNHVNKFKRTYNYEYTPITPDRIQECLDLEAEWCKANNCDQHEGTGNERRALVYALHNFEELGLTGGILHVDGKIVHRLIEPAWRERFLQSPQSLYAEAGLSEEEQQLLNARDWRGLIQYGASFFLLEKMGAVVGVSNLHIYAAMRGQTLEAFQQTRNQQVTYSVAGKR